MKNKASIVVFVAFLFLPIMIGSYGSFMSNEQLSNGLPAPVNLRHENLLNNLSIVQDDGFAKALRLTITTALLSSLSSVFFATVFSFVITRYLPFTNKWIFTYTILFYSLPVFIFSVGYLSFNQNNTPIISLFLIYLGLTSFLFPFSLWFLIRYMALVPFSFDRQAVLDGLSDFRLLTSVILPYLYPVLGVISLICFSIAYNDVIFSIVISSSEGTRMLNHWILEEIFPEDQTITRYAELLTFGLISGLIMSIISGFSLLKFERFLKQYSS